jgi:hypothetical protein
MAIFVLSDPKRSMYHPDAHRYYHLSRVSMSLGEVTITLLQMRARAHFFLGYISVTFFICDTILGNLPHLLFNAHSDTIRSNYFAPST